MTRQILVTGANGFVGSWLATELVAKGYAVYGLGREVTPQPPLHTDLTPRPPLRKRRGGEDYFPCDVTDANRLNEIIRDVAPEVVIHLASLTMASGKPAAVDYYRVNVIGTLNLLEAVRQHAPSARVILATSSAMYGIPTSPDGVINEDHPLRPVNPYGVSKAAQHLMGYQYVAQHGLNIIRVCPFNLIGPGQPADLAAPTFARQIVAIERGEQEPVLVTGDLSASRDFLDVRDAAKAYVSLIGHGQAGESYNLASGQGVMVGDMLNQLISLSGLNVSVQPRDPLTSSPIPAQIGSNRKLIEATGWQPRISLEQSLADLLTEWRGHPSG